MTRTQEGRGISSSRLMISVIAVAAVTGWSACAYSILSSAEKLNGQTAALQDYQAQVLSQRQKVEESAEEIARLQEQITAARNEIERLAASHKEAEANLTTAREQLASFQTLHASPALNGVTPRPAKQDVIAAQEALTRLGFGKLKADGVMGPTTREAIEEFQRVVGLTVTGELHSLTLQSLMRSAKVVAAQNERAE